MPIFTPVCGTFLPIFQLVHGWWGWGTVLTPIIALFHTVAFVQTILCD